MRLGILTCGLIGITAVTILLINISTENSDKFIITQYNIIGENRLVIASTICAVTIDTLLYVEGLPYDSIESGVFVDHPVLYYNFITKEDNPDASLLYTDYVIRPQIKCATQIEDPQGEDSQEVQRCINELGTDFNLIDEYQLTRGKGSIEGQSCNSNDNQVLVLEPSILNITILSDDNNGQQVKTFEKQFETKQVQLQSRNIQELGSFQIPVKDIYKNLPDGQYDSTQELHVYGNVSMHIEGFVQDRIFSIPYDSITQFHTVTVKKNVQTQTQNDPCINGECESDIDNDGIPDNRDQCPTEPEVINDLLDNDGCPDSTNTNSNNGNDVNITVTSINQFVEFQTCLLEFNTECLTQQKFIIFWIGGLIVFIILIALISLIRNRGG